MQGMSPGVGEKEIGFTLAHFELYSVSASWVTASPLVVSTLHDTAKPASTSVVLLYSGPQLQQKQRFNQFDPDWQLNNKLGSV